MSVSFRPLLHLAIRHQYYAGACSDLTLIIPPDAASLLYRSRHRLQGEPGAWSLRFESGSSGGPVRSLAGESLVLGLRLLNRQFENFTDPAGIAAGETPVYIHGEPAGAFLPPVGARFVMAGEPYRPRLTSRPLTLRLEDLGGTVLDSEVVPADREASSPELFVRPDGVYRILEIAEAGAPVESLQILSEPLRRACPWGLVVLKVDEAFYATAPKFTLEFQSLREPLKYYIVASNYSQVEFDQLSIADNGFLDEGRSRVQFEQVPVTEWTGAELSPELLAPGGGRLTLFRSTEPVMRRERGLRRIQLNRNGEVLVENLPQPGSDRPQMPLIVSLSKP